MNIDKLPNHLKYFFIVTVYFGFVLFFIFIKKTSNELRFITLKPLMQFQNYSNITPPGL